MSGQVQCDIDEGAGAPAPPVRAERVGPSGRHWLWLVLPLVVLALAAGVVSAPVTAWANRTPLTGSVEAGFARDMQLHHQQAIDMSLQAMRRASDVQVRLVALDVATAQLTQVGMMSGWLADWELPRQAKLPAMAWMSPDHASGDGRPAGHQLRPDGRMPGMASSEQLAALRDARGLAFDRRYLGLLITHHRGGLAMAQQAADRTSRDSVGALAQSIASSQAAEVQVLSDLLRRLGGTVPDPEEVDR